MYFILFINTYLINQNMLKFNFKLTLPYYIVKFSAIQTLKQKKFTCNLKTTIQWSINDLFGEIHLQLHLLNLQLTHFD